uniref:Retrovirus-related Pol polyprotein from transposon TNT 1-94 n=1 Tax=Tanacetum cinerariifolium TaxID=118510 RepID=A0A6L2NTC7_TANCI|nr:retrovirus-related Pol polyprotein from transposon TNT 1-94 [Tanacetum cinerariifolium]
MVQKPVLKNVEKRTGQRVVKPVWNNAIRTNHQNFSNPRRNFTPIAVLTKFGIVPISTARQSSSRATTLVSAARPINTVASKPLVNVAKPRQNALQTTHSLYKRPFYQQTALKNRNLNNNVNAATENYVNTAKGNKITSVVGNQGINAVKSSACWVWRPKIKVQDHVSKNTGSYICKRFDYVDPEGRLKSEHEGGYVAFGVGAKGGKITGKGTIRTGKQHKVSFKSKLHNFICQPLFMLHMDLFGPTSVSSIMHKKYCLVITDDFSRFTWVFFLATNDETSRILKSFITEIENLVEKKVKIIRCDNRTKFKNRVMNEFCEEKGIKREFSVARTPQQNRVAERRNMTLIETARTMLANSKLPTTFWAEAVNTACYVQNRVIVVKPYFKIPYELFKGRSPALSFTRPFGCHFSILNTLDQLGKFDRISNEGIFVGYSTTSKAFRIYHIRTRKVEENLHITFLENKPMIVGGGLEWLFDLDALSKLINYAPVFEGTNSNDFAGKGASFDADSHNKDKHGPSQASNSDNQKRPNAESSTKIVNTAGPVNTTTPTYADLPNDPLMPDFKDDEIFDDAYDDRDEGAEADYDNLETVIPKKPKKVTQTLDDESWVEAMQEELLQFKLLNVWTLVDLPPRKRVIGTKWVYRNKRDLRSKARLVAQGHRQEKGIYYAVRLFLAYASFMDFTVYQMDVESAFLYGTIEEEVYVSQHPGFVVPEFPN